MWPTMASTSDNSRYRKYALFVRHRHEEKAHVYAIAISRQSSSNGYNPNEVLQTLPGFEDAWAAVAAPHNGEPAAPELRPLLHRLYTAVLTTPVNLGELKASLIQVFEYLCGAGRTNANCWAVDLFFCLSEGWERDWTEQDFPDDFHDHGTDGRGAA